MTSTSAPILQIEPVDRFSPGVEPVLGSAETLQACVRGLRLAFGAVSASLLLPIGPDARRPVLVHDRADEGAQPVPELSSPWSADALPMQATHRQDDEIPTFLPSSSPECVLVSIPDGVRSLLLRDLGRERMRRASDQDDGSDRSRAAAWVGLRFRNRHALSVLEDDGSSPPGECEENLDARKLVVALVGLIAQQSLWASEGLEDRVTGLPGRVQFRIQLDRAMTKAQESRRPFSLLLVNPDCFSAVNEKYGRQAGDEVMGEIAARLCSVVRKSDIVAKYGGAIFSVLLFDTEHQSSDAVAAEILRQLGEAPYLDGALFIRFSVGSVSVGPDDQELHEPSTLVRRADRALSAAKQKGGGRHEHWTVELEDTVGATDVLHGIFTGDMSKDYRNMALLSDTVVAVASSLRFEELTERMAQRMLTWFKADKVALCALEEADSLRTLECLVRRRDGSGERDRHEDANLSRDQLAMVREACSTERTIEVGVVDGTPGWDGAVKRFAVPIAARGRCMGCLYIEGRAGLLAVDSADTDFLDTLGSQLALAFERASLLEQERRWQEEERRRLGAQLDELQQLSQSKLVFRSSRMKALLDTARRVAETNATVLVTGDNGTGKELIAQAIHRLSPRRDRPVAVVDCTSIPASLIESELFGHERGAYTGADRRKAGRLAEADGGTVILDEIGELPLEVQSKLLRFVQEKEVIAVGGNLARCVDVRIVAVTNRDLKSEAAAGRFREDLYHRLNVIHLQVPPLSMRRDDVLLLAKHFAQKFSTQHLGGSPKHFAREAEESMERYSWPGNVRELHNRVLQAVILTDGSEIGSEALGLNVTASTRVAAAASSGRGEAAPTEPVPKGESVGPSTSPETDTWDALREALSAVVDSAATGEGRRGPPIGRWLADELILQAHEATGGVTRRGATRLGIPEATLRRRLRKAQSGRRTTAAPETHLWQRVRILLTRLLETNEASSQDLPRRVRDLLLRAVCERFPGNVSMGSALMGVTEPTFRRWERELQ